MCSKGDVFWLRSDEEEKYHLHVIISDPQKSPSLVLVPITSIYDKDGVYACRFSAGSHHRIQVDSYVDYRLAKLVTAHELAGWLAAKTIKRVEPMSGEQIEMIWNGAEKDANYIPHGCRSVLFAQGLLT